MGQLPLGAVGRGRAESNGLHNYLSSLYLRCRLKQPGRYVLTYAHGLGSQRGHPSAGDSQNAPHTSHSPSLPLSVLIRLIFALNQPLAPGAMGRDASELNTLALCLQESSVDVAPAKGLQSVSAHWHRRSGASRDYTELHPTELFNVKPAYVRAGESGPK